MTRKHVLIAASAVVLTCAALAGGIAIAGGGGKPAETAAKDPPCIKPDKGRGCLPLAPESKRVDLARPSFSNPTKVTNPLHPTAEVPSVVMLGRVDRLPFRTEVTVLPETKAIEWNGRKVETLVSQYVAFLDGRIHEVALDWYAQADDGSVWYFGEQVFNYEDGVVADTEGTWIAGKDGPAAMIMPAHPRAGDVYRPENIPGRVLEEVTVKAVNRTVHGPHGPVAGAIVVEELHQDGTREDKIFAPGYGEFLTGRGGELEAAALAARTDALPRPAPAELDALTSGATAIFDAAARKDWQAARTSLDAINAGWDDYRTSAVPGMLDAQMSTLLSFLVAAVDARQAAEARQAAVDVARAGLDLQLRHRPAAEVDLARLELWMRQLQVDVAARKPGAVAGDVVALEWTRDRIAHTLDRTATRELDSVLRDLRTAADDEDLGAAANAGARLRATLAAL
jgi:hypothetical protein